jgi:prepilin-type N-terminal cleavage/methylation domain-containing protein
MHRNQGFTLLELLVVIAISAILMALSAAGLSSLVSSSTTENVATDVNKLLKSARNHAIETNSHVVFCFSDSTKKCSQTSFSYQLVFVDKDNDGVYTSGTDKLLSNTEIPTSNIAISSSLSSFVFISDGSASNSAGHIYICPINNGTYGYQIKLLASGKTTYANKTCS